MSQPYLVLNGSEQESQFKKYRRIITAGSILIAALAAVVIVLAVKNSSSSSSSSSTDIYVPDTYLEIYSRIDRLRNTTHDPCDNFYEYACGNLNIAWGPEDTGRYIDSFTSVENKVNAEISSILSGYFPFVTTAYTSCVSSLRGESTASIDDFQPWIQSISSIKDVSSLLSIMGQLDRHNLFQGLFDFEYNDMTVWVGNGYTGQVTLNVVGVPSTVTDAFKDGRLAKLIQKIDSSLNSTEAAQDIYNLATNLQSSSVTVDAYLMTLSDFLSNTSLPLDSYFKGYGTGGPQHGLGQSIDLLKSINLRPIQFSNSLPIYNSLSSVIAKSSWSTWQLYLKVMLYVNAIPLLPVDYTTLWCVDGVSCVNPFFALANVEPEVTNVTDICTGYIAKVFNNLLAHEWVAQDYSAATKAAITDMVENLYQILGDRIDSNPWLDAETKAAAKTKWSLMKRNVGFNNDYNQYIPIDVTLIGSTIWDLTAAIGYLNGVSYANVNQLVSRDKIPGGDLNAWDANAFYEPETNSINMIPGLQFPPFFSADYPILLNVATYGWVIGHEMTHGFDSSGRNYDGIGQQIDWWTANSTQGFNQRAECLVNQYSQFPVLDTYLNGTQTLGENIADNGGISVAWDAYKRIYGSTTSSPDTKPSQAMLSKLQQDLQMTMDQIFFLWAGQTWCMSYSDYAMRKALKRDVHSLPKYRVIGTFANHAEFAQAWKCPATSKMGRGLTDQACHIW